MIYNENGVTMHFCNAGSTSICKYHTYLIKVVAQMSIEHHLRMCYKVVLPCHISLQVLGLSSSQGFTMMWYNFRSYTIDSGPSVVYWHSIDMLSPLLPEFNSYARHRNCTWKVGRMQRSSCGRFLFSVFQFFSTLKSAITSPCLFAMESA